MGVPPKELTGAAREAATRLFDAGQAHLFRFWDRLTEPERRAFGDEISDIDVDLLLRLIDQGPEERSLDDVEPVEPLGRSSPDHEEAAAKGRQLLESGRVAFYTVAGGQGTRLGYDGPKGCYPIAPRTGKTLYEWHAEQVLAVSRRYRTAVPWVIMVSGANAARTREYFEERSWFGLEGRVTFVRQRMLPAVDGDGGILLRSPGHVALSPNGHGGAVDALFRNGTAERLAQSGVEVLSYFQVDNPLVNPADPAFLGYMEVRNAEMSAKVVEKRNAAEKAGVVARVDGRPGVVEYSEIPEDLARAVGDDGKLVYRLANIAAHGFRLDFLKRIHGAGLPFHVARKRVPTVDEEGQPVTVTGRKFEMFIFDAIPLARGFYAYLTERSEQFAPLKNKEGDDSPKTVRRAILDRTRGWYEDSDLPVPESEDELELSPLAAYDRETFREWAARRREDRT